MPSHDKSLSKTFCTKILNPPYSHKSGDCISHALESLILIRVVQNFSAKSLRRRIYHVMAYARNQNFSAFSNHLIFPHFLSETTVTWQIKILVQSQFQNFSAFSNNCDLTCPKLISHDSLMTHLFFFLLVYNYES